MNSSVAEPEDALLASMKSSRKGPAVLKTSLVSLRSMLPDALIFAFEGNDDKSAYYQWIRAIRADLCYEPFPCGGKAYVLTLRAMIRRDVNELGRGVYFFVDRDFDDLMGMAPDAATFMTDTYSIENYLVSAEVVDELLKNEFHCHGHPAHRQNVLAKFEALYEKFLGATADVNFRIFCAKRLGIAMTSHIPSKLGKIVEIDLNNVARTGFSASDLIGLEREPLAEELPALQAEFDAFDRAKRYRGKFARLFLMRWLSHLADDRRARPSENFSGVTNEGSIRLDFVTTDTLASKSRVPFGLQEFVAEIPVLCRV